MRSELVRKKAKRILTIFLSAVLIVTGINIMPRGVTEVYGAHHWTNSNIKEKSKLHVGDTVELENANIYVFQTEDEAEPWLNERTIPSGNYFLIKCNKEEKSIDNEYRIDMVNCLAKLGIVILGVNTVKDPHRYIAYPIPWFNLTVNPANGGGGYTSPSAGTIYGEVETGVTITAISYEGYEFVKWETSGSCASLTTLPTSKSTTIKATENANVTIRPVFKQIIKNTVTLNANDGTGDTKTVEATEGIEMPAVSPPIRDGFVFQGYFDNQENGKQYYKADGTSANPWDKGENTTLYAQWKAKINITSENVGTYLDYNFNTKLEYNGASQPFSVTKKSEYASDIGDITVKYYDKSENTVDVADVKNAGDYKIKINIAASTYCKAVNDLELGTYTISKRKVTITADDKNSTYVATSLAPLTTSFTSGDLINPNDLGTITPSCEVTTNSDAGEYPITVTYTYTNNPNYEVTTAGGIYTVNKCSQDAPQGTVTSTAVSFHNSLRDTADGAISISGLEVGKVIEYKLSGAAIYTTLTSSGAITLNNLAAGTYLFRYAEKTNEAAGADLSVTVGNGTEDNEAPTVSIEQGNNTLNKILNTLTFGHFFKDTTEFTIFADDTGVGVDENSYAYYLKDDHNSEDTWLTEAALAGVTWTSGSSVSVNPESKFVLYVKVSDKLGNTAYAYTDGIQVVYVDTPVEVSNEDELKNALDAGLTNIKLSGDVELTANMTIDNGVLITGDGHTITVPSGSALTNNGTLNAQVNNSGDITNNGTFKDQVNNEGKITNKGTFKDQVINSGTIDNSGTIEGVLNEGSGSISSTSTGTYKASYRITYNSNITPSPTTREAIKSAGSEYIIERKPFTKDKKYLLGWNTDKDATSGDAAYEPGKTITVSESLTLYAIWSYDDGTAKIGNTYYKDMAEAAKHAVSGDTIKIESNQDVTEDLTLPEDVTVDLSGKTLTINNDVTLNGGTYAGTGSIANNGTLNNAVIKAGSIVNGGTVSGGTNNGTIKDAAITGNLDNKNGRIEAGTIDAGATVTGGTIKGLPDITNNGTISGAKIEGTVDNQNGTIESGEIASGATVTGGDITGNTANSGTIKEAELAGSVKNTGTIDASSVKGAITGEGTLKDSTIEAGASITDGNLSGNITNHGIIKDTNGLTVGSGLKIINDGDIKVDGNLTVESGGNLKNENKGSVAVIGNVETTTGGTLENNGDMSYSDTQTGTGTITGSAIAKGPIEYNDTTKGTSIDNMVTAKVSNGAITVIVESVDKDGNPSGNILNNIVLSDLEDIVEHAIDNTDKAALENGKSIQVKLTVKLLDEPQDTADKTKIEDKIDELQDEKKGMTLGNFVDITLQKKQPNAQSWTPITETTDELEITIDVPSELQKSGRTFFILRNHEGTCDLLSNLSTIPNVIRFKTGEFSTYAITYVDAPKRGHNSKVNPSPTIDEQIEAVKSTKLKARSRLTQIHGWTAVQVNWYRTDGVLIKEEDFDGFEVFRSTKKNSGYGNKPFYTAKTTRYFNSKGLKDGTKYYYKVRGFKVIDGTKYYTPWSKKACRIVHK